MTKKQEEKQTVPSCSASARLAGDAKWGSSRKACWCLGFPLRLPHPPRTVDAASLTERRERKGETAGM